MRPVSAMIFSTAACIEESSVTSIEMGRMPDSVRWFMRSTRRAAA
jgi:hypothetical protein